jgi:hypothetical protein
MVSIALITATMPGGASWLEHTDMASGTWHAAVDLVNVFFSIPFKDSKVAAIDIEQVPGYIYWHMYFIT